MPKVARALRKERFSMVSDAAATDGEHPAADPPGGGRGGGLPRAADFRDGLLAGGRLLVRSTRLFARAAAPGRPLDRHRPQLRQVCPEFVCLGFGRVCFPCSGFIDWIDLCQSHRVIY